MVVWKSKPDTTHAALFFYFVASLSACTSTCAELVGNLTYRSSSETGPPPFDVSSWCRTWDHFKPNYKKGFLLAFHRCELPGLRQMVDEDKSIPDTTTKQCYSPLLVTARMVDVSDVSSMTPASASASGIFIVIKIICDCRLKLPNCTKQKSSLRSYRDLCTL